MLHASCLGQRSWRAACTCGVAGGGTPTSALLELVPGIEVGACPGCQWGAAGVWACLPAGPTTPGGSQDSMRVAHCMLRSMPARCAPAACACKLAGSCMLCCRLERTAHLLADAAFAASTQQQDTCEIPPAVLLGPTSDTPLLLP